MAATAISRTTLAGGHLVRSLVSLARRRATTPFRSFATFETPETSDEDESEETGESEVVIPDKWDARPGGGGGRGSHEMWRDSEGLHARLDMPGLDMEHIKVVIEHGSVTVRGKGPEKIGHYDRSDVALGLYYCVAFHPAFKLSAMQMKMKNGVVNVLVPAAEVGNSMVVMMVRQFDEHGGLVLSRFEGVIEGITFQPSHLPPM